MLNGINLLYISIHALREEGDNLAITAHSPHGISIHALREEGDFRFSAVKTLPFAFLSTPSARRATGTPLELIKKTVISIHALREEGDITPSSTVWMSWNFYPRPPRGGRHQNPRKALPGAANFYPRPPRGGRRTCGTNSPSLEKFLSTPSARRATLSEAILS